MNPRPAEPLLPAEATTTTPREIASMMARRMALVGTAEPSDMLITPAPWLTA